jgi:hypothetical protein
VCGPAKVEESRRTREGTRGERSQRLCTDENGHSELTVEGLGDAFVAFFDKMVRSLDEARISSFVADIIG